MSDLQSENKEEELEENINDEYRKEKREQQTSRLLIDEENNKYKIDYICKTNPKIFWKCVNQKCQSRVYTIGFCYPIYYIDSNHNHGITRNDLKSKYKKILEHSPIKIEVKKPKKNIIYHFKA